jgi:hypothetical protein
MAVFGAMNAILGVNNSQWKTGFAEARAEVDKTSAKTKGFFKDLASQAGKNSDLGKTLKLLSGGGAIAGFGLAAKEFEGLTEKILEVSEAARKGDTSFNQAFADIIREIPILGNLTKGFDNLRYAITGEMAVLKQLEAENKATQEQWKVHISRLDEAKHVTMEWRKEIEKLRDEWALLSASPNTIGQTKAGIDAKNALSALRDKYEKDAGFVDEKTGGPGTLLLKMKEVEEAEKRATKLKAAIDTAKQAAAAATVEADKARYDQRLGIGNWGDKEAIWNEEAKINKVKEANDAYNAQVGVINKLKFELGDLQRIADAAKTQYDTARGQAVQNEARKMADAVRKDNEPDRKAAQKELEETWKGVQEWWKSQTQSVTKAIEVAHQSIAKAVESEIKEGERITRAMRTPQEVFADQLKDLQHLRDLRVISPEIFARAGDSAFAELMRSTTYNPFRDVRIQAEELMLGKKVTAGDVPQPLNELAQTAKAQLDELKKANRIAANRKVVIISGAF